MNQSPRREKELANLKVPLFAIGGALILILIVMSIESLRVRPEPSDDVDSQVVDNARRVEEIIAARKRPPMLQLSRGAVMGRIGAVRERTGAFDPMPTIEAAP